MNRYVGAEVFRGVDVEANISKVESVLSVDAIVYWCVGLGVCDGVGRGVCD